VQQFISIQFAAAGDLIHNSDLSLADDDRRLSDFVLVEFVATAATTATAQEVPSSVHTAFTQGCQIYSETNAAGARSS
jgi:hypothetical protein